MKKFGVFFLFFIIITSCTSDKKKNPVMKVMLDWVPNTNHVGLYLAQSLGYFEEAGITVEIIQPLEDGGLDFLLTHQVDLLVGWESTLFFGRDRGLPIVAVAAILQHNDSVLVSLPEAGIERPRDLVHKRYLSYGGASDIATIEALMLKDGVKEPKVSLALTGEMADLSSLLLGKGDYLWLFRGWDVLAAKLRGIELNEIVLRDVDEALNFYTPMYISTQEHIEKKEEAMSKLIQAIAKGYEYASVYPYEASKIFHQMIPGLDKELIEASLLHLSSLYVDDLGRFGLMERDVFQRYLNWSINYDILPESGKNIKVEEIFTNSLLINTMIDDRNL